MRVAIVALSCQNGGMLHYASQLANSLASQAEVHFFTPAKRELADYLSRDLTHHPTLQLSYPGQPLRTLSRQLNPLVHGLNAQRIRKVRPDVIHLVTAHPANSLLLPLLGDTPVCFTLHDPSAHPGESTPLKDFLMQRTIAGVDRLIVHGEALRTELAAQGIEASRIAVIPHGDYGFLLRHAGAIAEEPMILCLGRLSAYKGLEVLCQAERLFGDRLGDYRVCIAGEGDPELFREEIGPSGRIDVINRFLSDEEVAHLFQRARLVVLPYTQASQSGVLAIAQAFGKAAIVTDVGGLPEAVAYGEAGLIVPPRDASALAEAVVRAWHDPELRQRLAWGGRARVEQEIGWPIVAQHHLALYRQMGANSAPAGAPLPLRS
ncbi:glycosyltransferase family 4 protein [bacterium]|nr:glycosyltransferase family 4 protein [bacterium]